jgi:hypothetical protein
MLGGNLFASLPQFEAQADSGLEGEVERLEAASDLVVLKFEKSARGSQVTATARIAERAVSSFAVR